MRVHFLSINPFTNIPSLRFIIDYFIQTKAQITISEIQLKNANNYYLNSDITFKNIAEFEDFNAYKKGLKSIRVKKYIKLVKIILSSKADIFYTNDYQVVFFYLLLNRKAAIIYHQFELIETKLLGSFSKLMFNYVLKKANKIDLCIFPEKNRANYFIENSNLLPNKSFIFPNTCEVSTTNIVTVETCIDFIPADFFKIIHVGSIGSIGHYFSTFIEATKAFSNTSKTAFIFIGRKTKEIDELINKENLSNVYFIDAIPHEELLKVYTKVDLGIILYKGTNLNFEFCAPNKLYEFWANGIPVIAHNLKGLEPLFTTDFLGRLTDFNNSKNIVTTIENLKELTQKDRLPLINYFKSNFEVEIYISLLDKHIQKLV